MIVADTNLIAYLLIPGDSSEVSVDVFRKDPKWIAPQLWRSEFRNILTLYMRQQGMTLNQAQETMGKAESIMTGHEYALNSDSVLQIASNSKLSAYDCEFVALAKYSNVKLVTFDKLILKNANKIAISASDFIRL